MKLDGSGTSFRQFVDPYLWKILDPPGHRLFSRLHLRLFTHNHLPVRYTLKMCFFVTTSTRWLDEETEREGEKRKRETLVKIYCVAWVVCFLCIVSKFICRSKFKEKSKSSDNNEEEKTRKLQALYAKDKIIADHQKEIQKRDDEIR